MAIGNLRQLLRIGIREGCQLSARHPAERQGMQLAKPTEPGQADAQRLRREPHCPSQTSSSVTTLRLSTRV